MLREGDISIPVDRTLEYSRPLRSLRLWMCLRVHGAAQYRRWIEGGLANARALAELVRGSDDFELLNEPMLSTVCFRHVPAGSRISTSTTSASRGRSRQKDGSTWRRPSSTARPACVSAS